MPRFKVTAIYRTLHKGEIEVEAEDRYRAEDAVYLGRYDHDSVELVELRHGLYEVERVEELDEEVLYAPV